MRPLPTITAAEMRAINRTAVLDLIRRQGRISRSMIAGQLKISLPTVMRIVEDLQQEGLVRASGEKERSGGRRRPLIELNTGEYTVVGVDLGGIVLYGAVTDIAGNLRYESSLPFSGVGAEDCYLSLENFLVDILSQAKVIGTRVLGIGIGVPGITYPDTGRVGLAPSLSWQDFPLRDRLEKRFPGIRIDVENDVNLAALGELWFGAGREVENLVLVAIGTGIGAGVVINGDLYPGRHNTAGEIGYFLPDRSYLRKNSSQFGALEQLASAAGIARQARERLAGVRPKSELQKLVAEDVFTAARAGEAWALEVMDETLDYLAQAVAALHLLFDPDVILLGGGVTGSADLLVNPILNRLKSCIPTQPNLQASTLGYRAAAMGAIVKLLRLATRYYSLQNCPPTAR